MNEAAMTPEQEKLHNDLIRQYGVDVFGQARELSGSDGLPHGPRARHAEA
jgi:hypothetical protein